MIMRANSYLCWVTLTAGLLVADQTATAYEQATHVILTEKSVSGSVLSLDAQLLEQLSLPANLGLTTLNCTSTAALAEASCVAFQGAFDEDQIPRMANHFFDYQNSGGALTDFLFTPLCSPFTPSPQWILAGLGQGSCLYGITYAYDNSAVPTGIGVKQSYYRALTESTLAARQQQTLNLFLSLGHVLHHLQDMAQPQHVRNDNHCNPNFSGDSLDPLTVLLANAGLCVAAGQPYAPSAYEAYVAQPGRARSVAAPVNLALPSPIPFNLPTDFWTSAKGIPAFTSMNFFSAGTNLQEITAGIYETSRGELIPGYSDLVATASISSYLTQYYNLRDPLTGTPTTHPATAQSALKALFPGLPFGLAGFKLTPLIYADQMQTLLPQAMKYSEYFIDYLFRGSISATLDSSGNLTITNKSTTNEALSNGSFTLYADASGVRSPVASCAVTGQIAANGMQTCALGSLGSPPASGSYLLVFSGQLGQEQNQVAFTLVTPVTGTITATFTYQGTIIGGSGSVQSGSGQFVYDTTHNVLSAFTLTITNQSTANPNKFIYSKANVTSFSYNQVTGALNLTTKPVAGTNSIYFPQLFNVTTVGSNVYVGNTATQAFPTVPETSGPVVVTITN
jgi:hypothetical protein